MREPITIVVEVRGGVIQCVSTSLANPEGVRVVVVDYDNGCDADEGDDTPRVNRTACSVDLADVTTDLDLVEQATSYLEI